METESHIPANHVHKDNVTSDSLKERSDDECHAVTSTTTAGKSSKHPYYCTRAVTGCCPMFQEIYVCHTCVNPTGNLEGDDVLPPCICFACVNECHSTHEIEYVGMGPCFCDCNDFGCTLYDASIDVAHRCGFSTTTMDMDHIPSLLVPLSSTTNDLCNKSCTTYVRDVYTIPTLKEKHYHERLVRQAKALVQHSKDTFWLDSTIIDASTQTESDHLCDLEYLAWEVFRQHMQHYVNKDRCTNEDDNKKSVMGAEWWVQVKEISSSAAEENTVATTPNHSSSVEAIDLHYDKDEEMAAMFGLGIFPFISTVTYLSEGEYAPPTIIFSRRYDEVDDDDDDNENPVGIADMFVSHPKIGKHIVFDGRLLHGAPSHLLLRYNASSKEQNKMEAFDRNHVLHDPRSIRITFLVNIWMGHRPVGVHVLPASIRTALLHTSTVDIKDNASNTNSDTAVTFTRVDPIHIIHLQHETDLPESLRQTMELPFVGGKATWGGIDDDDDVPGDNDVEDNSNTMVVVTYPPPRIPNCDTLLVVFAPNLAPHFKYED